MWVYLIYQNEAPHFNTDDFCEWHWMSVDEVAHALTSGDKAKNDLPKILHEIKHLL
jgi:hypothetical protein